MIKDVHGKEAFKIDFENAYKHEVWGFFYDALKRKDFSLRWRSWIKGCLSLVSFVILVNGHVGVWVKETRGLRPDALVLTLLFIIEDC